MTTMIKTWPPDLQALFVCKCDARMRRRNSTRYSSDAICSGSKGIAKNSQVPGNPKGQARCATTANSLWLRTPARPSMERSVQTVGASFIRRRS